MNLSLLSSILRKPWFIDQQSAVSYLPVINSILGLSPMKQNELSQFRSHVSLAASHPQVRQLNCLADISNVKPGSIALITLKGPLVKDDEPCGNVGMNTMAEMIQAIDNTPGFVASILYVDSPGGTVDGTQTLADAVHSSRKPVVAFVDGMMASAALWIGSAADHVIANSAFDQVGSVGVIMSIVDLRPAYEKLGVRFHDVVSTQTPDKLKTFTEILSGKYENLQHEVLDPLADHFIHQIQKHLPNASQEYLTGRLYFARNVQGVFVNEIGSFDRAVSKALQLAQQQSILDAVTSLSITKSQRMNTPFPQLLSLLGLESLESTAEGSYLSAEQLSVVEDRLTQLVSLEKANARLESDFSQLSENYQKLNAQVVSLSEKVDQLSVLPGEQPARAISQTDNPAPALRNDRDFAAQYQAAADFWKNV
jgi:protease-4